MIIIDIIITLIIIIIIDMIIGRCFSMVGIGRWWMANKQYEIYDLSCSNVVIIIIIIIANMVLSHTDSPHNLPDPRSHIFSIHLNDSTTIPAEKSNHQPSYIQHD